MHALQRTAFILVYALAAAAAALAVPDADRPAPRVTTGDHTDTPPPDAVTQAWKNAAMMNQPIPTTLRLAVHGGGVIDRPPWGCYTNAVHLKLAARPLKGWRFVRWTGAVQDGGQTNNPAAVFLDANLGIQVIMAVFAKSESEQP